MPSHVHLSKEIVFDQEVILSNHLSIMCHYASAVGVIFSCVLSVFTRETRESWSLQTVKTEVNGDSKSTNERGSSLVGSLGLMCWWYKRFLFCLGGSSGPVQNISFLTVHYFNAFASIAQQAGQAAVPGRLSLRMCLH
jgi:hypothetical protein